MENGGNPSSNLGGGIEMVSNPMWGIQQDKFRIVGGASNLLMFTSLTEKRRGQVIKTKEALKQNEKENKFQTKV